MSKFKKVPRKPVPYVPMQEGYKPVLSAQRGNGKIPSGYLPLMSVATTARNVGGIKYRAS